MLESFSVLAQGALGQPSRFEINTPYWSKDSAGEKWVFPEVLPLIL